MDELDKIPKGRILERKLNKIGWSLKYTGFGRWQIQNHRNTPTRFFLTADMVVLEDPTDTLGGPNMGRIVFYMRECDIELDNTLYMVSITNNGSYISFFGTDPK